MKYKDPVTGELKDIIVKSGDTLPIGTIVEFDGDTIPDGYEEFETEDYGSLGTIIVDDVICKNIYNPINYPLVLNRAISGEAGNTYAVTSGNWYATELYIPVNKYAGKDIISSSDSTTICFYDSGYNFISSIKKNGVIPTNAYYMRFDTHKDYVNELYIELGKELTGYVPHKEFSNKQIYSTEEQVIGTWIDGKPLYRRTFNITSPSQITSSEPILILDSNCSIVKYDGFLDTANNGRYSLNCWFSSDDYIYSYVTNSYVLRAKVSLDAYSSRPITVTLEYTKTTD